MRLSGSSTIRKFGRRFTRAAGTTFLLTLPLGYYPEATDSTDLYLGVHGGAGNVVTVIRDCNGNPLSSVGQEYTELSASAYLPVPKSPLVFGVRGGGWYATGNDYSFTWINPDVSLETRYVGIGIGYLGGDVPLDFGDLSDPENVPFSGHLRLGNPRKFYLRTSVAEMSPLISGGGLFVVGVGFPVGSKVDLYSAFSAGFYDQPGFAQQARIRLHRNVDLLAAFRLGEADNKFEGSVAGGLQVAIGR
jgi:hypothetical protein